MKSRIIKTKFWNDSDVLGMSANARYLFLYLLSSPHINLCGVFELPVAYRLLETGMTNKQLGNAQDELAERGKVFFLGEWVYVRNASKHNNYQNSPKNQIAFEREWEEVPNKIKKEINEIDSGMDSSIDTPPIVTRNQKPEIINQKSEKNNRDVLDDPIKIAELKAKFPTVDVDTEIESMKDWLSAQGKTKKDYVAFARNWLRRTQARQKMSFRQKGRNTNEPIANIT